MEQKTPEFTIGTDASIWGAHLQDDQISGSWTSDQHLQHINVLEILAIEKAFFPLASEVPRSCRPNSDRQLYSDVLHHKTGGGGAKSLSLCMFSWRILC